MRGFLKKQFFLLANHQSSMANSQFGFTLIELMVVFSVMVILTSIGIASFVTYSHSQQLDTSMKEFKTTLFTARSRALSQLRDASCFSNGFTGQNYQLKGYQVVVCCSYGPICSSQTCNGIGNNYELQAVYDASDGSGIISQTCVGKKFSNPTLTVDTSPKTTATYFFFSSVTGAVTTNAGGGQIPQVAFDGYGITKVASVSATGIIQ